MISSNGIISLLLERGYSVENENGVVMFLLSREEYFQTKYINKLLKEVRSLGYESSVGFTFRHGNSN